MFKERAQPDQFPRHADVSTIAATTVAVRAVSVVTGPAKQLVAGKQLVDAKLVPGNVGTVVAEAIALDMQGSRGNIMQSERPGRWVYSFGRSGADGRADMLDLLGGKGAGLAEMARIGVPVPPGFTISTEAGLALRNAPLGSKVELAADITLEVESALARLENETGRTLGDPAQPLLVSVRSGAAVSMPGMMDTILNLGLNDDTVEGLASLTGDRRFAYDCYRRLIQTFGEVVSGVDAHLFDDVLEALRTERSLPRDDDFTGDDWQEAANRFSDVILVATGLPFPQDPRDQLREAITAIFRSWRNSRAAAFRALHGISEDGGTAATVQLMVFGNRGAESGTGVAHSRDPNDGAPGLCGEFLCNAQGEDVVSGLHTPESIDDLRHRLPAVYAQLQAIANRLEQHFADMQEIEFTVERGNLFLLQARAGKRSFEAAVRIATDLAEAGVISRAEAVTRADLSTMESRLRPIPDPSAERDILARGLPASTGAACGALVFSSEEAVKFAALGQPVVLCRDETSPHDVQGMQAAVAIVTARGGATSHAATVARALGRPCVTGARMMRIDQTAGKLTIGGRVLCSGDVVTVDGTSGELLFGSVPMIHPTPPADFVRLLEWARELAA